MIKIILLFTLLFMTTFLSPILSQSPKRGIAYGSHSLEDINVLKPGVSWWYNWSPAPESALNTNYASLGVEFVPMAWGKINDTDAFIAAIKPGAKYLLAFNEPNFNDGAKLTPQEAVNAWPNIEKIAAAKGLEIVSASPAYNGPDNYGGYQSPVAWHDEFFRLCPTCKVDYIAFHTYDNTASSVIGVTNGLKKFDRPVWVTEFANRVIQTAAEKINFMKEIVSSFENDPDIYRYSWFTARVPSNWTDMLEGQLLSTSSGVLKPIGVEYVNAAYTTKQMNVPGQIIANKHYRRKGTGLQNTTDGGTGQNVCFINAGDWAEYMINVVDAGSYNMKFRVASPAIPGKFDISVNGIIIKTDESFPITGGWQTYTDKIVKGVVLPKGQVYLKIIFKTKDFNFNYIDVTADSDLGIGTIALELPSVEFFPNPFSNEASFKIKFATNEKIDLKIIDMKGIICYSSEAFFTNQNIVIGASLHKGMYIVTATYGTSHQTFKIVKN
jgi:Glycosyl hydrolase catalytic core/Carbohydrate binding module (family 6)/Secretion system C-terminal sorting domain